MTSSLEKNNVKNDHIYSLIHFPTIHITIFTDKNMSNTNDFNNKHIKLNKKMFFFPQKFKIGYDLFYWFYRIKYFPNN